MPRYNGTPTRRLALVDERTLVERFSDEPDYLLEESGINHTTSEESCIRGCCDCHVIFADLNDYALVDDLRYFNHAPDIDTDLLADAGEGWLVEVQADTDADLYGDATTRLDSAWTVVDLYHEDDEAKQSRWRYHFEPVTISGLTMADIDAQASAPNWSPAIAVTADDIGLAAAAD